MSKTKSYLREEAAEPKTREKMIPLTVRFSPAEAEALKGLAAERGVSLSALIRHGTCGNVAKCLGDVWYVDRAQAAEIDAHIVAVGNIIRDIRTQLARIGSNYNQEIRLRQIQKQREALAAKRRGGSRLGSFDWSFDDEDIALMQEAKKIRASGENLSVEKLDELITRYEDATRKAGEALWHIRG